MIRLPALRWQFALVICAQVLAIAGAAFWFLGSTGGGAGDLLGWQASRRVSAVASTLSGELARSPREQWDAILDGYADSHGGRFSLIRRDGMRIAGSEDDPVPPEVLRRIPPPRLRPPRDPGMPPDARGRGPQGTPRRGMEENPGPPEAGRGPDGNERRRPDGTPRRGNPTRSGAPRSSPDPVFLFFTRAGDPPRYYAAAAIPLRIPSRPSLAALGAEPVLLVSAASFGESTLFFDPRPWMAGAVLVLGVSFLFWTPLLLHIQRRLRRLTRATEAVAAGDFHPRLEDGGRDEISRLSRAVETMARDLDRQISGQRRFLADAAHELCAPLARLRLSLDLLESHVAEPGRARCADVQSEVAELSTLIEEILDFSRTTMKSAPDAFRRTEVAEMIRALLAREAPGIECQMRGAGAVTTDESALQRALGNLVRNAATHGAPPLVIDISDDRETDALVVLLYDHGSGVPEEWLPHLFEPFSRVDASRDRRTGGHGLGLAIAHAAARRIGGNLGARNRPDAGLEFTLRIPHRPSAAYHP